MAKKSVRTAAKPAAADGKAASLADLLLAAGPAEIEAIDAKLAEVQERIEQLEGERRKLQQARKVINFRLIRTGGKRASPTERRDTIYQFLAEHGPASMTEIARATEIPIGSVTKLLDHEWFAKETARDWAIATAGSRQ